MNKTAPMTREQVIDLAEDVVMIAMDKGGDQTVAIDGLEFVTSEDTRVLLYMMLHHMYRDKKAVTP